MKDKLVITIMAAGEGKRMNSTLPKVLHLFNGEPMLVRIIKESSKLKPHKIIVITGKYHSQIKLTLNDYLDPDTFKMIHFVKQNEPKGTAHAIKQTLEYYDDDSNVLILNGDMPLITSNILTSFIGGLDDEPRILVAKLDNPYGYGRILSKLNVFIGIKEEKDCNQEEKLIDIINVGIYYFHSTLLKKYVPIIDNNNCQNEFYLTDIVKVIKNNSDLNIKTYQIPENYKYQIMGVNTQSELQELELKYKNII